MGGVDRLCLPMVGERQTASTRACWTLQAMQGLLHTRQLEVPTEDVLASEGENHSDDSVPGVMSRNQKQKKAEISLTKENLSGVVGSVGGVGSFCGAFEFSQSVQYIGGLTVLLN